MIALFIAAVQDLIIGGGAETQDNDAQGERWRCSRQALTRGSLSREKSRVEREISLSISKI